MKIRLKRLLVKGEQSVLLRQVLEGISPDITILDDRGEVLWGVLTDEESSGYPILQGGDVVGRVIGNEQAEGIAALLTHLIHRETEMNTLADQMLDLYREVNLFYNLSEKLGVSLEVDRVINIALEEACRLIHATDGAILLREDFSERFSTHLTFGDVLEINRVYTIDSAAGLISALLGSGKAEIVNEATSDTRYLPEDGVFRSIISAPLLARQQAIGWIILVNREPTMYLAGDLKLLTALAAQVAPAVENALLHEKTLREAKLREVQLQRRIDELRIELDEARQEQKVNEIVETEYFQHLRKQSEKLRRIIDGGET